MTTNSADASLASLPDRFRAQRILASLDQSAFSKRHILLYCIIAVFHFFDGYDLIMNGVILPGVRKTFAITMGQAGMVASGGFVGMLFGAVFISMLADRIGRKRALFGAVAWYTLLSFAAAFAPSYHSLLLIRTIQGLGLGAEVPLVYTFLTEFVPVRHRGMLAASTVFFWQGAGLVAALSATIIIPHFTWRGMLVVGSFPALLLIFAWFVFPESPRYLIVRGKIKEAEEIVRRFSTKSLDDIQIEQTSFDGLTKSNDLKSLFGILSGRYLRVTIGVWILNFVGGVTSNGLSAWLPTIFLRMGFAQNYSFTYTAVIVGCGAVGNLAHAAVVDRIGRRATLAISYIIAALAMFAWGYATSPAALLFFGGLSTFFGALGVTGALYTYMTELYPTARRASAVGCATGWQRFGGIVTPTVVGIAFDNQASVLSVFMAMGGVLIVATVVSLTMTYETKDKPLEEITNFLASKDNTLAMPQSGPETIK